MRGNFDPAVRLLERALALCRDWTLPIPHPLVLGLSGLAAARAGQVAEGVSSLLEAAPSYEEAVGTGIWNTLLILWVGEAHALGHRYADALEAARRALRLTQQFNHSAYEGWALRLLGEIASHTDPLDLESAEGHYQQALVLAQARGMRPLLACCHLGLGRLHRKASRRRLAQEHLTVATTMYREMDMPFWLEQAEAEMDVLA